LKYNLKNNYAEKYETAFGEKPTSYEAGIRETVAAQ
jgi:hypothetical protein